LLKAEQKRISSGKAKPEPSDAKKLPQ